MFASKLKALALAVFLLSPHFALAQAPTKRFSDVLLETDSLKLALPDSARIDTTAQKSDFDAPVDFEAQMEDHDLDKRITYLYGRAKVKYKTMTLEAGKITVDWHHRLLIAEPLPDSLLTANGKAANGKTKSAAGDSLAKAEKGYPIFLDGGDRFTGERMEYNFSTEKGRVLRGRTELDDGKYFGAQIKRADSKTLFVSKGIYSTCDREENPHFHFWSRKMKVVVQDKVVARPIVLFIGKIPMAIFPFAFFPTRSGRHSGLLVPRFGASQSEGRYLRGLGYYFALSDYYDLKTTVDFYERSGWLFNGELNYAKRYSFTGNISGSFTRKNFSVQGNQGFGVESSKERRWDVYVRHSQTFSQTAYLNVSGSFASSKDFYKLFSGNRNDQLRRTVTSQATFSKSFAGGASLSLSASEYKDLDRGSFDRSLPQLSLSFGQRQLFGKSEPSKKKSASGKIEERRWYENFYYSLSSSAQNRYSRTADTTKVERLSSANHNISLSLNGIKAFFYWLNLSQSMQVTENWYDRTTDYFVTKDTLGREAEASRVNKGFAALHLFNYNASMSTKLYGTFQPNLGPVRALRHVMEPSIGFSFRPDFSDSWWGYFNELRFADGRTIRRDRFNGASGGQGKQGSMSISVRNLFQMKTGPDDKLKKIDLFTLSFSTSHNFAAKTFRQSDLSTSLFATPIRNFSFSLSSSHSFYDYDTTKHQPIDRLLYKRNGIFSGKYLRLTNVSFDASWSLQGKSSAAELANLQKNASREADKEETIPTVTQDRFAPVYFTDTNLPWNASFALRYNHNLFDPTKPVSTFQLSLSNASVTLSKNWRLNMSGQFDVQKKQIVDQHYTITRDLHCWEMRFNWTPTGFSKGFYFYLGIKAPLLRDLKIEKRGGRTSVFGGGSTFY